MNSPATPLLADISLCDLPRHMAATITQVMTPANPDEHHLVLRLIEIGFLPGESLRVVAHGHPGHEPIAVRLGHTTFALRRHEAAFIRVQITSDNAA
ncbi:MAG TPA: FeoA family protein [Rhodocyclaceae bacterium]|nr:FeoA family protein [Rhodocyclaceae bacterium]